MSLTPVLPGGPHIPGLWNQVAPRARGPEAPRGDGAAQARAGASLPAGWGALRARRFTLSAQSLSVLFGAGGRGPGGGDLLGAVRGALAARPAVSGAGLASLRESLEELGLSDESIRDLLMLAELLARLDPKACERLVEGFRALAEAVSGMTGAAEGAPVAGAPAASGFRLDYVSISISITEVSARMTEGPDGSTAEISARRVELRLERLEISMSGGPGAQPIQQGDPLVLDLEGDGVALRPTSEGVLFDLAGTGEPVQTAFVAPGDDAVLFYDENGNGVADSGGELIGGRVKGLNAFEELAQMDEDGDGLITRADAAWSGLRLWQDLDGNGASAAAEVALLDALGLAALSVLWEPDAREEGEGLVRVGAGEFFREDGSRGLMLDYLFGYRAG